MICLRFQSGVEAAYKAVMKPVEGNHFDSYAAIGFAKSRRTDDAVECYEGSA